jgi:hypothetical protein
VLEQWLELQPLPTHLEIAKTRRTQPAQRRSKLRHEEFLRKKREQGEAVAAAFGTQKSADVVPNQAAGHQQLLVQLESQQLGQVAPATRAAEWIPQLDDHNMHVVEPGTIGEEAVTFTFISEYGDTDVRESLEELIQASLVPSTTTLAGVSKLL